MEDIKPQLVAAANLGRRSAAGVGVNEETAEGMDVGNEEQVVGTSGHVYEEQIEGYVNPETGEFIPSQGSDSSAGFVNMPLSSGQRVHVLPSSVPRVGPQQQPVYRVAPGATAVMVGSAQAPSGVQYMRVLAAANGNQPFGAGRPSPQAIGAAKLNYNNSVYVNANTSSPATVSGGARGTRKSNALNAHGRKPCNCSKSGCLKLYCDCFANGEFCQNCNCKDCRNDQTYTDERTKAIRACLERNPNAFQPKIVASGGRRVDASDRQHLKGCHCKKSNCLKNYCECYEAKVGCSDRCRCVNCRNSESDRMEKQQRRAIKYDPFARQTNQQTAANALAASGLLSLAAGSTADTSALTSDDVSRSSMVDVEGESTDDDRSAYDAKQSLPWYCMTDEVIEATTLCLVAQAEEIETRQHNRPVDDTEMEASILREFGRCLHQIITNAANS